MIANSEIYIICYLEFSRKIAAAHRLRMVDGGLDDPKSVAAV
jgi:hypothetical protein